jgi:hypothetical protein
MLTNLLTACLSHTSKKSNHKVGVAFHEHEDSYEVDQLYNAIVNGEASTSDLDGVADISLLWSAIILIVRSTELLMYQRSSIEPSELAVHIQRFIGALFSTFENLLEHQTSCTTYLVQSMIQSCSYNNSSFNEKRAESELILVQMMSEYRSLFPYAYMFNRRTGKSPPSQIDKVTECFHRSDPAANSYENDASPSEPASHSMDSSIGSHHDVVSDSNSELGDSFDNIGTFLAPMISAPSIMPLKPVKMLSDDEHYGSDYQPAAASDIDSDMYDAKSNFYREGGASKETKDGSPASGDGAAEESGVSILSSYYKFSSWNTMMEEDEDSDTQDGSGGDYRPPAAHPSRTRRATRMRSTAGSRKALSKATADSLDEAHNDGITRSHTTRIKRSKRKKSLGNCSMDGKDAAPVAASMTNSIDQSLSVAAAAVESAVMDVQPFDSILAIQDLNMSDMDDAGDITGALVVETLSDDDEHAQRVSGRRSASHRSATMVVAAPASLPSNNSSRSQQRDHRHEPPIGLQTRWGNAPSSGPDEDSSRMHPHIRTPSSTNVDAPLAPGSSRAGKPRIKFRNPLDASLELDNSVEEFTGSDGPDDNNYSIRRSESDLNLSLSETDTDPESYPSSYKGRIDDPFGSPMKHTGHEYRRDKSAVEAAYSAEAFVDDPPTDTTQHGRASVVRVPTASPPRRPKYDVSNWDSVATAAKFDAEYDPPVSTGPLTNVGFNNTTAGHTAPVHADAIEDSVEETQRRRERLQKVRAWIAKRGELKQSSPDAPSHSVPPETAILDEPSSSRRTAQGSDACDSTVGTIRKSVSFRADVVAASEQGSSFSPGGSRDSASSYDVVLHGSRDASFTSKAPCSDEDESENSSENLEEEEEEMQLESFAHSDPILVSDPGPSMDKGDDKHRNGNNSIDHHSDAVLAGGSNDLPHQCYTKLTMDKPFSSLPSACKLPELSEFATATGVIMEGYLQKKSSGVLGRMMLWRQVSDAERVM